MLILMRACPKAREGLCGSPSTAAGTQYMHRAGGHGLTTAAREDPLPWERQGSRGKRGEASARLSNGWRVM